MIHASDAVQQRDLFFNLTLRELRGKYRRSALGWFWSLLNPLSTLLIFSVVFSLFLRVEPPVGDPSGLDNFSFFLMAGLLPFTFFQNTLTGGLSSMTGNSNLVKKVYFRREVLVASSTASHLVAFLIEMGLLLVALLLAGNNVLPWIPAALIIVVFQIAFGMGIAFILAAGNVYFRDLEHLTSITLQLWFYATPIVYPLGLVRSYAGDREWIVRLYLLNPMARFVEAYRDLFYDLRFPPFADIAYLGVVSFAMLAFGLWVFGRFEPRLAEEL